jgi:predicted NAD/FAD-binding protein
VVPSVQDTRSRTKPTFGEHDPTSLLLSNSYYAKRQICVHDDMYRLRSLPWPGKPGSVGRVIVTLNPVRQPDAIQCRRTYYLSIISSAGVLAARNLDVLNKADNVSYTGAWMGYAFHGGGSGAGLAVANKIRTGTYENPTRFRSGEEL